MRIICLILIVCLGLATAKYLPNESASLTQLSRNLRSIEDDSAVTNENKSDNDDESDDDTSEEGTIQETEEKRQELLRIQEEQKRKQEEEHLKLQEKILKEERKKQEKIEKEERKRQEKLEKEERKRQEKIEKEKKKQEEAKRKQQEKIEKEERKRLEKVRKQLEELEKDTLESNKIPSDSSESTESNESNESLDMEDIWMNYIYAKYGLSVNNTDLERKAAQNKYFEEELGLNVNSTKSERRLAVIKLIQSNLYKDDASQNALRNFLLSHVNAVAIQQLQVTLEDKIDELNNKSVLLENSTMPGVPEAKQTIDEKRTLIQSVLQLLSHLLPNWATGGLTPSNINSNTTTSSQGNFGSPAAAPNANDVSPNLSGAASSSTPELGHGPAASSVDTNSGSNVIAATEAESSTAGSNDAASNSVPSLPSTYPSSSSNISQPDAASSDAEGSVAFTDVSSTSIAAQETAAGSVYDNSGNNVVAETEMEGSTAGSSDTASNSVSSLPSASPSSHVSQAGGAWSGVEGSTASSDVSSTSIAAGGSVATSPVGNTSSSTTAAGASDSSASNIDSTTTDGLPSSATAAEQPTRDPIKGSTGGSLSFSDNSALTEPANVGSISIQESISSGNSPTSANVTPSEGLGTPGSADITVTGPATPDVQISGSTNASFIESTSTGGSSGDHSVVTSIQDTVTGSNSSTQESSVPSKETVSTTGPIDVAASDVETPANDYFNDFPNGASTSGDIAAVTGPNTTQESSVPFDEPISVTGPVSVAVSASEAPAISSIDGSLNGASTSGDSAIVTRPNKTESTSAHDTTTDINKSTIAGAGLSEPVDVSSTATIVPENPTIVAGDTSSTVANSPGFVNVVLNAAQEPAVESTDAVLTSFSDSVSESGDNTPIVVQQPVADSTDNLVGSPVSTAISENNDVISAGVEQAAIGSVGTVIESTVNSIGDYSNVLPETRPVDAAFATEVPVTDVVTTIDTSSADVLPNTGSPNIETTTGFDVVTESLTNVNATETASVLKNVSDSPDATPIVVDVSNNYDTAAFSVSGATEITKVEGVQTSSPGIIATDVTVIPEIVTVHNSVTPGNINVETVTPTTKVVSEAWTELASVAPEVNRVPESGSSIFLLPNEPGASVIEITPQ